MSITSVTLSNGTVIETTAPISDLLPMFMQEPTAAPIAAPQPKAAETTSRTTAPKERSTKAKVAPKGPKAQAPKVAKEVTVFDRKATYSAIMQEAKSDPEGAKAKAAKLGWVQVVETIDRRQAAKLNKAPKAAKPQPAPKQEAKPEEAKPVVVPAPPKAEQKRVGRQVKRTRKAAAAKLDEVAAATAAAELPEVLPTDKAERAPKGMKSDWQARRGVLHAGSAVCLGCNGDVKSCVCKSSTKCSEATHKAFVSTQLARQYPEVRGAEHRALVELALALEAA